MLTVGQDLLHLLAQLSEDPERRSIRQTAKGFDETTRQFNLAESILIEEDRKKLVGVLPGKLHFNFDKLRMINIYLPDASEDEEIAQIQKVPLEEVRSLLDELRSLRVIFAYGRYHNNPLLAVSAANALDGLLEWRSCGRWRVALSGCAAREQSTLHQRVITTDFNDAYDGPLEQTNWLQRASFQTTGKNPAQHLLPVIGDFPLLTTIEINRPWPWFLEWFSQISAPLPTEITVGKRFDAQPCELKFGNNWLCKTLNLCLHRSHVSEELLNIIEKKFGRKAIFTNLLLPTESPHWPTTRWISSRGLWWTDLRILQWKGTIDFSVFNGFPSGIGKLVFPKLWKLSLKDLHRDGVVSWHEVLSNASMPSLECLNFWGPTHGSAIELLQYPAISGIQRLYVGTLFVHLLNLVSFYTLPRLEMLCFKMPCSTIPERSVFSVSAPIQAVFCVIPMCEPTDRIKRAQIDAIFPDADKKYTGNMIWC